MGYHANVNAIIPETKETPLHLAAVHGYTDIFKYLVDGRDHSLRELELYDSIVKQPFYQSWTEDLLTNKTTTVSNVWELEARDSAEEHIGLLRSCSNRYSDINLCTSTGHTALDLAASYGNEDIVRFLLERGAGFKSESGVALQKAVENGHLETVKLLLAAEANTQQQSHTLASPLQYACLKGHNAVADFVVWHYFNKEFSTEPLPWPTLCLPSRATNNTVVRDAVQKRKPHTKLSKLGTHGRFAQRLSQLAESPKD